MKLTINHLRRIIAEEVQKATEPFNPREYYDRVLARALEIADEARAAGRTEPSRGVAKEDWEKAASEIKI